MTLTPETIPADATRSAVSTGIDRFDIADGGPFVALQQRIGLLESTSRSAPRRAAAVVAVAFGVPLVLALFSGTAIGPLASRPYLLDWGVWARFVLAVSVFFLMERLVEQRLKMHLRQFVETPLLAPGAMPKAAEAVTRALRRRDMCVAELVCIVLAYLISFSALLTLDHRQSSWLVQGLPEAGHLTVAGWWVVLVSGPLFWFMLLRWLWRHLVWALLLRDLARLDLRIVATHPDGLGGLAFIGQYPNAFTALVFSMSCVVAAAIAKAFQQDALQLTAYGYVMAAWLALMLALFAIPLLAFARPLRRLKEQTLLTSTAAATRHFRAAERATFGGNVAAKEDAEPTPASEIPNPSAVYTAAKKLRTLPFSREAVLPVAGAAVLPLVVAGSTVLPLNELWKIAKKLLLL